MAPRHMQAIKDTGNNLIAALDKNDSVGILDNYFPGADFFTEFERFDRHLEKLKRQGQKIDYVSVCSPNHLHDAHVRFGLRAGADVICEKPLVLNPWNVDALADVEKETGRQVFTIMQLRLHPAVKTLKEKIDLAPVDKKYRVNLQYITARGHWYHTSWKGELEKSGGIATNIGIHFFDLLLWIFGDVKKSTITHLNNINAAGELELERADVNWMLSIDANDLPEQAKATGRTTLRTLTVNDEVIEFSDGFTELHTLSYIDIMNGKGFSINETRAAIQLVHDIRNKK